MITFKSNREIFEFIEKLIDLAKKFNDEENKQLLQETMSENFTTSELCAPSTANAHQ
jgi:ribosomal protein L17